MMKKRNIITILAVLVLAVLFAGFYFTAQPELDTPLSENVGEVQLDQPAEVIEELVETEAQATTEVQVSFEDPQIGDAYYVNFDHDINGLDLHFEGGVYDSLSDDPIPSLIVDIYCDNSKMNLVGIVKTDENGLFDFSVPYDSCDYGVEAWLQVEYNENDYESPHITLPEELSRGGGGGFVPLGIQREPAGMPEFSVPTLAIAIVLAGLGLAYFRKR